MTVNRMRLDEVISWFSQRGYKQTASYFMLLVKDECTVLHRNAFWIDTKMVHGHLGDRLFNEMECDVVTWMPETELA
jgi:hypothetical protein